MPRREAWRQGSRYVLGLLVRWDDYLRHREFTEEERDRCEAAMEEFVQRLQQRVRRPSGTRKKGKPTLCEGIEREGEKLPRAVPGGESGKKDITCILGGKKDITCNLSST